MSIIFALGSLESGRGRGRVAVICRLQDYFRRNIQSRYYMQNIFGRGMSENQFIFAASILVRSAAMVLHSATRPPIPQSGVRGCFGGGHLPDTQADYTIIQHSLLQSQLFCWPNSLSKCSIHIQCGVCCVLPLAPVGFYIALPDPLSTLHNTHTHRNAFTQVISPSIVYIQFLWCVLSV